MFFIDDFLQEVIMMLEQSTKDFKSLIERLHVMKAYEDAAKDGDRYGTNELFYLNENYQ